MDWVTRLCIKLSWLKFLHLIFHCQLFEGAFAGIWTLKICKCRIIKSSTFRIFRYSFSRMKCLKFYIMKKVLPNWFSTASYHTDFQFVNFDKMWILSGSLKNFISLDVYNMSMFCWQNNDLTYLFFDAFRWIF